MTRGIDWKNKGGKSNNFPRKRIIYQLAIVKLEAALAWQVKIFSEILASLTLSTHLFNPKATATNPRNRSRTIYLDIVEINAKYKPLVS